MSDTSDQLQDAANSPKSAASDGQSASAHSLPDRIAMDKYLAEKERAKSKKAPLQLFKCTAPGGTGQ